MAVSQMPRTAWRIQAPGPFCPCRCHIVRRKFDICRYLGRSILMITNGLTLVFGSKPLSWGTFRVLFGPPGSLSVACLCPLGDTLEIHACLLQNTSMDALCRPPSGRSGCHSVP